MMEEGEGGIRSGRKWKFLATTSKSSFAKKKETPKNRMGDCYSITNRQETYLTPTKEFSSHNRVDLDPFLPFHVPQLCSASTKKQ